MDDILAEEYKKELKKAHEQLEKFRNLNFDDLFSKAFKIIKEEEKEKMEHLKKRDLYLNSLTKSESIKQNNPELF